jgi:hypothetical protein
VIKAGTVARQHHKWTSWVEGRPLIVFHEIYTMDTYDAVEPQEDWPQHYHYRIVIEGDSSTELILQGAQNPDGGYALPGYTWTAMGPANAIPAVCDARPGFMSHNELGLMPLRGVIRP